MIVVYEGDQGSCKTTMAVRRAIRIADKQRIYADIFAPMPIDHPRAHVVDWTFMLDPKAPPGIYIWDEAARATDSRRSQSLPPSVTNNFTEHRKHVRDVLITTQIWGMIDSRLRGNCQERHLLRGRMYTKRRYGVDDDGAEIVTRREHPRWISRHSWAGRHCQQAKPEQRSRMVIPWSMLASYADRFDTARTVELAGHIAAGKDFYRDQRDTPVQLVDQVDNVARPSFAPRGTARHAR
jgi:hypothetical protein